MDVKEGTMNESWGTMNERGTMNKRQLDENGIITDENLPVSKY
jgi:hypothetical protein